MQWLLDNSPPSLLNISLIRNEARHYSVLFGGKECHREAEGQHLTEQGSGYGVSHGAGKGMEHLGEQTVVLGIRVGVKVVQSLPHSDQRRLADRAYQGTIPHILPRYSGGGLVSPHLPWENRLSDVREHESVLGCESLL